MQRSMKVRFPSLPEVSMNRIDALLAATASMAILSACARMQPARLTASSGPERVTPAAFSDGGWESTPGVTPSARQAADAVNASCGRSSPLVVPAG